jgi:hypothetical protein
MSADEAPDDRLRERAKRSRLRSWLLFEADRLLVAVLVSTAVFVVLVATGYLYPGAREAIGGGDSVDTLFQGFLTATITGVTLVVTLNQLVLSQEFGAVGDQRERMEEAMQFREDVADAIEAPVSPVRPSQFLRALVQVAGERASEFRDAVPSDVDDDVAEEVETLTGSLTENAERVSGGLDDARFGRFEVILSALDFNYSWKIFTARRLNERHGDSLTAESTEALERLIEVLLFFGPAREHFKTLYFQWDLIVLSRRILAASLPALLVSTGMILFFDAGAYGVAVFDVDTLVLVVSAAATVAVVPFVILLAYVMRIATVTRHTLSIGPFILRETDEVSEVEWDR